MDDLVNKFRQRGVVVDSNLLVLLLIGGCDRSLISKHKRTGKYTAEDYDLLVDSLGRFRTVVTTPNVLTEVGNLLRPEDAPQSRDVLAGFQLLIEHADEHYVKSITLTKTEYFTKHGLADAATAEISASGYLVLTDDLGLCSHLQKRGIAAVNFNHIRQMRISY